MGMTITEKIFARASGHRKVTPGQLVDANIDVVMCHDVTTPPAISMLVERGMPGFSVGKRLKKVGMKAQDTSELFFDNVRARKAKLTKRRVSPPTFKSKRKYKSFTRKCNAGKSVGWNLPGGNVVRIDGVDFRFCPAAHNHIGTGFSQPQSDHPARCLSAALLAP